MKRFIAAAGLAVTCLAFAAPAPIDASKSRITATFTQMNVGVDGDFRKFSGSMAYDPANVAASTAALDVDTSSFDIGDDDYNAEVRKKEWFDTATFPAATFRSTSIKPLGGDAFEAAGTLTLKGKALPVTAKVSVKTDGPVRRFTGELPLSRKAFAIGDPQWDDVLADGVTVKFTIVTPAS